MVEPTISSVVKDGNKLTIALANGEVLIRSIIYADTVVSEPPDGHLEIGNITINGDGHLVINYDGGSITIDPDSTVAVATHVSDASAHHTKYTDAEALAAAVAGGMVVGPASATDERIMVADGVTGKKIKQSGCSATPQGAISGESIAVKTLDLGEGVSIVQSLTLPDAYMIFTDDITGEIRLYQILDCDYHADGSTNGVYTLAERTKLSAIGAGADVVGPASSTDNEIARQHSNTGKVLQTYTSNPPTISDTGDVNIDGDLDVENVVVSGNVDGIDISALDTAVVKKADFNAQTVLAATTDDTPAALTVAEQTVVGRVTAGNVAALTVAQLQALLLSTALPENVAILLDSALSADGKYCAIEAEAGIAGAILAFGDLCYFAVADSKWELTDASDAATAVGKIGICIAAAAEDAATVIMLKGKVRADTAFPALTIGAPVHIGEVAGDVVVAAPSTASAIVRIIGYGNTADELYFCPDNSYVTIAA